MRSSDLLVLAAFWAVLSWASVAGVLAAADGRIFDFLLSSVRFSAPASVAVVNAGDAHSAAAAAATARRAGAVRVVTLDTADLGALRRSRDLSSSDAARCRPPTADGILRALPLRDLAGRPCPLARMAVEAGLPLPSRRLVSPDFAARTSTSIPRLDAASLRDNTATRAALQDRIAVVVAGPDAPTHITPLYAADGLLEASVPYAMTLDALARGRAIVWSRPGVDVLFAALVILLLHLVVRRSPFRRTLAVIVVSAVPVLVALALILHAGRVHVPATASLLAIGGFALRSILLRHRALAETLIDVDHRLTGLVGQPLGQGFDLDTERVWEEANRFVTEFFVLRRSVMLELPPGATHMRAVAMFGCTHDDIIENRRDYRRAPYSTALARALPTPPSRPFLRPEEGVVDLITALMAADQLVGFWALSVTDAAAASLDSLSIEAGGYANEVAKVILRAGNLREPAGEAGRRWPTLARLRGRLLDGATQAREQISAYRDVFSAVGHPIAVCDLLGRVQFANPAFEDFAEAAQRPLMAMSVTNMLEQLCGLTQAGAKKTLRHVVLRVGAQASLPMTMPVNQARWVLVLRPILRRTPDHSAAATSPFDLLGMIVEMVPDARAAAAAAARQVDAATMAYAERSAAFLASIGAEIDALAVDDAARARLAGLVEAAADDARTQRSRGLAACGPDPDPEAPPPVELGAVLERVWQALARAARDKGVEVRLPEDLPSVSCDEASLTRILVETLALLLEDAGPGTPIVIGWAVVEEAFVRLRLANEGYGMPPGFVADTLRGAHELASQAGATPLERLASAVSGVDASIRFALESELGAGYRASLTIARAL